MQGKGAIVAEDLVKVYGGKVRAVDGVSFEVAHGEIFGFLGPNGAGKTTTVSMLSAGLRPTSGRGIIDGLEVGQNAEAVKRRIGVIFQESTADGDLTGRENLEVAAGTYGISRAEGRERATALIAEMHLTEAADRYAKTYSGGMRRRLELAVGLVHRPKGTLPGRTDPRSRPPGTGRFLGFRSEAPKGDRDDRLRHDPLPRRGRHDVRPDRDHRPREDRRQRDAERIEGQTGWGCRDHQDRSERPGRDGDPESPLGRSAVQSRDDSYRVKCASGETLVPLAVEHPTARRRP